MSETDNISTTLDADNVTNKDPYTFKNEKCKNYLLKALIAVLCAGQGMIALTLSADQVIQTYHEISRQPILYFLGSAFLFLLFYAIALLTGRSLLIPGIVAGFMTFVALVNYYELQLHGTVLTFQDIRNVPTAARALAGYRIQISPAAGAIIFSFAVLVFILMLLYSRGVAFKAERKESLIPFVLLLVLSYVLVLAPFAPVKARDWSWEIRYYEDSVPVGMAENVSKLLLGLTKPDGYNVEEIKDIPAIRSVSTDNSYPDIVVVLDETYYDMDHLLDFNTDVSFMRNYDALDAYKGYATVPMIGGGTNASEYELLTSNCMNLLSTTTPFNDMNLKGSCNIVEYLKKLGYSTMAAHSEPAGNYHRGDAWRDLGFEATYFAPDFTELNYYESRYSASDSSLFRNFTRFYEAMPEEQPRFAYLLTIQNHGDWDRNTPDKDTVHIQNNNGLYNYEQQINEYLTCIQQTDDFIADMVDYFSKGNRDVVVYMVGDHGPSFLKEWDLGDDIEINLKKRQVPYFIWSRQGFDESAMSDMPENTTIDMCALTPLMLKAAGLPLSSYYSQILRLSENVQSLTGQTSSGKEKDGMIYFDNAGAVQDVYSGTEEADLVRKYYYMEYNRLQKKGRVDELFDP